ncbi:MAG TPA: glucoamylase family protein [Jatrophihabitans sp.]|nr:glucoamylase family protein [Jatrophihabitans sp.]
MRGGRRFTTVAATVLAAVAFAVPSAARAADGSGGGALSGAQRATLFGIARDTWAFYRDDVDPVTHLPLDNVGPGTTRGTYTSSANVGVYLWSVVAAHDLKLITRDEADKRVSDTLQSVAQLQRGHGFMYQWYDTTTGKVIVNPGAAACAQVGGTNDNCSFLSAVDNGWLASGLVVARQALPETRALANSLLSQMDFSIFYDNRPQTACNVNHAVDDQPTGQMYGGYYDGVGPAGYHNGALYSDPRIAMYMGMGLGQMPGDVWWRTWRVLPPKQCSTDPDFSWQGQWPPQGTWANVKDPLSGKRFRVWEGHYTYPGTSLRFLPTFAGGMFEGLMANLVVPETTWGRRGFGLADLRTVPVQIRYATEQLHLPVWGMSPSSTADDTGGYGGFGVEGLTLPVGQRLAQCTTCATETTVTPHASFLALPIDPQHAYANIMALKTRYPGSYTRDGGFYDAVNPSTGSVGHRRLVYDQSIIMAALDNALRGGQLQQWFAADPTSRAARAVLGAEAMTL